MAAPIQALVVFGDERMGRMLEIELCRLGIPARALDTPPKTPQSLRLLVWDGDTFPASDGESLAAACACPLLVVGKALAPDGHIPYLRRPFALSEWETLIRGMMESPSTPHSALRVGDGSVSVGGMAAPLTDAEWRVFSHLYDRRGKVVPREELAALLGGGGNSAEVYVCHLRRKLEGPLGRRLITTLRGVGYRMEDL